MADSREFIVRLKGDTKDLEAAVARAEASMEKIGDYEFKIKLNQKGSEAEIKSLLTLLSKQDIQVDIDANIANRNDIQDQLKTIQDVDSLGSTKNAKKQADRVRELYLDAYKDIQEAQDKLLDAQFKREGTRADSVYYEDALRAEQEAEEEYHRRLRRFGYLEELTRDIKGRPKDVIDEVHKQQELIQKEIERGERSKQRDWRTVSYADDYKYTPQDIRNATKEQLKAREAVTYEIEKELNRKMEKARNGSIKFRGKDIDELARQTTKYREQRNAEREAVIQKNAKAREGKDVLEENRKLLDEQEAIARNQAQMPEVDYSSMFDQGTDSAEKFVEELNKVDEEIRDMKTVSDLASDIIDENEVNALKKKRQKVQRELGDLYKKDVTRKDIEDDKRYKVTGYTVNKDGSVESYDAGIYTGKEVKNGVMPKNYTYDKRTGQWHSKGGQKGFDIEPQGKPDKLKIWENKVRDKQNELQEIDNQIKDIETAKDKDRIKQLKGQFDIERKIASQKDEEARIDDYYKKNKSNQEEGPDVFTGQYEKATNEEEQFIAALNEEAEASERAALARKNLESQKTVDDFLAKQAKKNIGENKKVLESEGMIPSADEYDSYYDSDAMKRYADQVDEAREAREKLNASINEKKVRDANEQALKEQEAQNRRSSAYEYDVFADQYAEETEGERRLTAAINERAEAAEKATLSQKNLESQNAVDDIVKQQESAKKHYQELQELYEHKPMAPTTDDYDSYYNSDGIGRYTQQTREAREETERLNEVAREGFVDGDGISKHTEQLKEDSAAAKENADANEQASTARGKIASGDAKGATSPQDAYKKRGAEANVASEEMSAEDILKRTEAIKEEGEKIKANAKEYEEDVIQTVSYYDSANNLIKLQFKTRKLVPDAEGSNTGQIETRTYTTNFDQESGASYTSHITDTKFVDNIQKQAKAQKILTQNIDESSRALERFIAEQKELGASFNADKFKSLRDGLGNIYDQQDLRIWKNEYKAFREETEASQKASKRSKGQQLSDADISNKNAIRAKNLDEFNSQVQKSSAVTDEFKAKVKDLYATLSSAGKSPVLLDNFDKQLKKYQADFKRVEKTSESNNKSANKRFSTYADRLNSYDENKYVGDIRDTIARLKNDINGLRGIDGKFNIDLNAQGVAEQVDKIDAEMKELKNSVSDTSNVLAGGISIAKLNDQMAQFVNKNHKLTEKYRQDIRELREELETVGLTKTGFTDQLTGNYVRGFDDILKDFKMVQTQAADEGLVGGVGAIENLGNRIKQMSTNFVAQYFSLYDIVRYARELGQTVTEINSAQTELRKVSDASQTRIQENFQKSAETAQEMGATISDVIASTSDWARLGYSVDDAETLARNTALYQSVGDNMTQETASEYLTSIMKGYQLDASQSESIIDKVNEVANNYSIDTRGLGEALQRSASAFNTAHTDLDKSIAIITASNEVLNLWHAA